MLSKRKTIEKQPASDRLAKLISSRIVSIQFRLASYLNQKAQTFSLENRKQYFCLFCLLFGASCLYVLARSLIPNTSLREFPRSHGSLPLHIGQSSSGCTDSLHVIDSTQKTNSFIIK